MTNLPFNYAQIFQITKGIMVIMSKHYTKLLVSDDVFPVGDLPHKEKEHPIFCFSVTIPISQPKPQIYNLFQTPLFFPKENSL
ncbi:hypothetical protein VNO80_20350 [Phaseolus coccineus]|uniref:Uncharacterized protein n=1 Tax=Phaseolus coccineus TaxID=3886 RepID=A0AAN9MNW6_PHACN